MADQSGVDGELRELALFAGAGGGILGGHLLGWRTVCAVERDPYAASVLVQRQNEGILPPFPIWDDVCTFDGKPWRGRVDVVSGGFPCQDISAAGRGAGIDGERSGLWGEMARIVSEIRPRYVFVENSPLLIRRGLTRVLGDLAEMGYDARWGIVGAADVCAPHVRNRVWVVGISRPRRNVQFEDNGDRAAWEICECCEDYWCNRHGMHAYDCDCPDIEQWAASGLCPYEKGTSYVSDSDLSGCQEQRVGIATKARYSPPKCSGWWSSEPELGRVADGVANRVDRLRCIGNGQVPAVAAMAWTILTGLK